MGGSGVEVKKVWLTNADHPGYGYDYVVVDGGGGGGVDWVG